MEDEPDMAVVLVIEHHYALVIFTVIAAVAQAFVLLDILF